MPSLRRQQPGASTAISARREPLIAGLFYGAATYASLPPLGVWPLTFVAAVALIWGGCRAGAAGRPLRGALFAALGTLPLWFAEEAWLTNVTPVGYPLLAVYLGLFSGIVVYALAIVRACGWKVPMSVGAPLVWVGVEVLRGEVILTGYPWYLAAHPLIAEANLCMPARLLGTYFVSFLVVASAGSLADAAGWSGMARRAGGIGVLCVAAVWIVAVVIARRGLSEDLAVAEPVRVGVVQTNIPQGQKLAWSIQQQAEDFERFVELTKAAASAKPPPDLIVWPETMFPGWALSSEALVAARSYLDRNHIAEQTALHAYLVGFADALCKLQADLNIPMLVGSEGREDCRAVPDKQGRPDLVSARKYNSVAVVWHGKVLDQRYDKVDLTPFGEVIPWVWRWPSVQKLVLDLGANGMRFDLAFGSHEGPIEVPLANEGSLRVATPICFEVTKTTTCRRLVYGGGVEGNGGTAGRAALLVNVSNDGWFGSEGWWFVSSDARRRQHLIAARWRCVELGVPMVRAVNTGISAFVDAGGRLTPGKFVEGGARPAQTDGSLVGSVMIGEASTLYGRIGDVFGWGVLSAGAGLFGAAWLRRRFAGGAAASRV